MIHVRTFSGWGAVDDQAIAAWLNALGAAVTVLHAALFIEPPTSTGQQSRVHATVIARAE